MKMMGMWTPASANSRCKSRPLTPGRLTSKTRQLGPSGGLLRRNSSAVPKDAHRNFADFSNPWMDARIPASSSTTNTVGTSVDVIQAPRPSVGRLKQKLAPRCEFFSAHKRPPCDSTMERLMRSPMPVPWGLVVKNALKIWSACCGGRSEEHTSELQSQSNLVCRLLLEKKKNKWRRIESSIYHSMTLERTRR